MLGESSELDAVTDWLEIVALAHDGISVGMQTAQQLGENAFGLSTELIGAGFARAQARQRISLENYPFTVGPNYIHGKADANNYTYSRALMVSDSSPLRTLPDWDVSKSSKCFEETIEVGLSDFFGPQTKALNFGFPSKVGRPNSFPDAVEWLSQKVGMPLGAAFRSPRRKDGGVDVVIWKDLEDSWGSVPLLLVQVTIMQDFVNKIGDIDIRLWSNWLSIDFDPMAALAVPHFVTNRNAWSEISSRGLLIDRSRILRLSPHALMPGGGETGEYFSALLSHFKESIF